MKSSIQESHVLNSSRQGYTLIELMVVMVILVILVATALPLVKRVMDNDRVRESSRQLNAYFNMAKVRAVQTGRPCGLIMILDTPLGAPAGPTNAPPYDATNPPRYIRQCTKLFLAEVPPTYAGSTQGARGRIRLSLDPSLPPAMGIFEFYPLYYNASTPGYEPDTTELTYLYSLINPGELFYVRFDYKGPWFTCQRGLPGLPDGYHGPSNLYYRKATIPAGLLDWTGPGAGGRLSTAITHPPGYFDYASPSNNPGYCYQIRRAPQPVGDPLELSGGTCIDMTFSGPGQDGNGFITANSSLAVIFSPTGAIQDVYRDQATDNPVGTLHLLLGRVKKMNDPTVDVDGDGLANIYDVNDSNLADATSLWVSVGRANGTVTTSENVPDTSFNTALGPAAFLAGCRSIATGREQIGGQ